MSSIPPTPEGNFVKLCQRLLESLSSMVKDARDNKLSTTDPSQLDSTRRMLSMASPETLVKSFIEKREHWRKIEGRSMTFLEKEIGTIFADAKILEAHVVEEPVRVYLLLKDWKERPETRPATKISKGIDYENPFINDDDVNGLWSKLTLMIKLACKWNSVNGSKYNLSEFKSYLA